MHGRMLSLSCSTNTFPYFSFPKGISLPTNPPKERPPIVTYVTYWNAQSARGRVKMENSESLYVTHQTYNRIINAFYIHYITKLTIFNQNITIVVLENCVCYSNKGVVTSTQKKFCLNFAILQFLQIFALILYCTNFATFAN